MRLPSVNIIVPRPISLKIVRECRHSTSLHRALFLLSATNKAGRFCKSWGKLFTSSRGIRIRTFSTGPYPAPSYLRDRPVSPCPAPACRSLCLRAAAVSQRNIAEVEHAFQRKETPRNSAPRTQRALRRRQRRVRCRPECQLPAAAAGRGSRRGRVRGAGPRGFQVPLQRARSGAVGRDCVGLLLGGLLRPLGALRRRWLPGARGLWALRRVKAPGQFHPPPQAVLGSIAGMPCPNSLRPRAR